MYYTCRYNTRQGKAAYMLVQMIHNNNHTDFINTIIIDVCMLNFTNYKTSL